MSTIAAEPIDELGRLLHADDPAAQLALAVVRLEAALAERDQGLADVDRVLVRTPDPVRFGEVLDVLVERFTTVGADPHVDVVRATLPVPGMLVALGAELGPSTHHHEGTT